MNGTTTIRLNDEDRCLLAQLVPEYGDQSSVIRHGIRRLAEEQAQRVALRSLLRDWEAESGPVDEDMVAEMQQRYYNR
ncbi:ribbon-helix-helix domain-containing protein [Candidatus Poriferisodalis sp.]|uniref:ribbon-helix-helix domain-containing protein n=1 Tax=Candidatus Poriferisodalis sp. TaxID=3101277 RepID=UPI003B0124CD